MIGKLKKLIRDWFGCGISKTCIRGRISRHDDAGISARCEMYILSERFNQQMHRRTIIIDLTTSSPDLAKLRSGNEKGISVWMPVSEVKGAERGELVVMVAETRRSSIPLSRYGYSPARLYGQREAVSIQRPTNSHCCTHGAFTEAIIYCRAVGIDPESPASLAVERRQLAVFQCRS